MCEVCDVIGNKDMQEALVIADIERLRRVMKTIEAEPERFSMGDWAVAVVMDKETARDMDTKVVGSEMPCGTTMCLAGSVVADEGIEMVFERNFRIDLDGNNVMTNVWSAHRTVDGRAIDDVAAELLGLPKDVADSIFYATHVNNVDELWSYIECRTAGIITKEDKV